MFLASYRTKRNSFTGLLFADDLLILGRTNDEIYEKLKLVQDCCTLNKMEINFGKTKILDKEKDRLWPVWNEDSQNTDDIEAKLSFSYLGVPVSFKGQISWTYGPHFDQIISRAKKYKSAIYKIAVNSIDRGETIKVCWENVALPSILFGCETTVFTLQSLKTLEKIQCEIAKLCLGVRCDTSGLGSRVEAGMMSIKSRIMIRQLNYMNSVLLRPNSIVYHALIENTNGQWSSPLRKLWSDIKSKSHTYGEFNQTRVKKSVMAVENVEIERQMEQVIHYFS